MKKNVCVKQHDVTDCGAACLSSVCAYYGLRIPIARVRQYASTDKKGTNVLGLVEAAEKLNMSAKGVRAQFEAFKSVPKPVIAHVIVNEVFEHYVVVYKYSKKNITYMDPADGRMYKVSHDEFKKIWTGALVMLEPTHDFHTGRAGNSHVKMFYDLLRPHKSMMTQALLGAFVYSVLGLSTSVYVGKITDYVLVDENLNLLNLMSIFMIIILLLKVFIGGMKSIIALKTGQSIDATLILGYYKHLLKLPQQFFDTMRIGEVISRVNDAVKIRTFINNVAIDIVVNVFILVITTLIMFVFSWQLALVTFCSVPFFAITYFLFNKLNKKYNRRLMENSAELQAQFVESLNAVSTIKRFGMEDYANIKTESKFVQMLVTIFSSAKYGIWIGNGMQLISTGVTIAVLWIGSVLVVDKSMTPGTLMMFYSLVGYVVSPISSLISSNASIQDALIAADRLFQIMDLETEESEINKLTLTPDMIGNIVFEDVSFRYGTRKDVFNNLSLTINKGKTTAIVGKSGSGKTTLISILQRMYPIQSGHIYIGDYDSAMISNKSLREQIGIVPQQVELFSGSIFENIALGDFNPDMKRIIDIVKELGLLDFIDGLPQGIDTLIGEHGATLSGGERQRVAIARAMYKNPDILLLDEATSSLDSIAEMYVKNELGNLARSGKTIIVIAHRLSTIKDADNIIVLDRGMLIEQGTHAELITNNGLYKDLWNEQFNIIE